MHRSVLLVIAQGVCVVCLFFLDSEPSSVYFAVLHQLSSCGCLNCVYLYKYISHMLHIPDLLFLMIHFFLGWAGLTSVFVQDQKIPIHAGAKAVLCAFQDFPKVSHFCKSVWHKASYLLHATNVSIFSVVGIHLMLSVSKCQPMFLHHQINPVINDPFSISRWPVCTLNHPSWSHPLCQHTW